MKKFRFLLTLLALSGVSASAGTTFDFVIAATTANQTYSFGVTGAEDFVIEWGDGDVQTGLSGSGNRSHIFMDVGLYTNRVSGIATRIAFGGTGTTPLLLRDIVSRLSDGVTGIVSATDMFRGTATITQFT